MTTIQAVSHHPGDLPSIKHIPNGARASRTFSDAEYVRRQTGLRRIIEEIGLEAALGDVLGL